MPLRRLSRSLARIGMPLIGLVLFTGCAKDIVRLDKNRAPRTFIVAAPLDSTGNADASKASYRVHLYWRGEDDDGYIAGFLWSFDDSSLGNFHWTTKTDSIFELLVNDSTALVGTPTTPIGTTKYHTFYIRAVDNLGKADPNLAVFNKRTFLATTKPPFVHLIGPVPKIIQYKNGTFGPDTITDTLSDGAPFRVSWSGIDSDGVVTHYRFDVGSYSSPIMSDSNAYFNDPTHAGSVGLQSGVYTMTVTAIDNANAIGTTRFTFVVNHDPETWILPVGAPLGHYIQPFLGGNPVNITGTFAPGDTVPYRSTVWWDWEGADTTGGEKNILTGWSVVLFNGTRNSGLPYTIGFVDTLCQAPDGSWVRFKTNNPAVVGPCGFTQLILDSLDAGSNMTLFVRSRDGALRPDGTPATFTFNCDFPPRLNSLNVLDHDTLVAACTTCNPDTCKWIYWSTFDYEDGIAQNTRVTIDGTLNIDLADWEQGVAVPINTFRGLSPGGSEGTASVVVRDRAFIPMPADQAIVISFPIP